MPGDGPVVKVMVVGAGGREHALTWKLAGEASVGDVICVPGNAGIGLVARLITGDVSRPDDLADLAAREHVDLTVVGPELPLDRGIVDVFRSRGLRIFGPSRAAAQLECSKVFAKEFMARHGIPTARFRICDELTSALAIVESGELGFPLVVKADGLAAGKGVVVAPDRAMASRAVRAAMEHRQFGDAGSRLVLEECLTGEEVSFFAICDGTRAARSRRAGSQTPDDEDQGPNTGGWARSPSPLVTSDRGAGCANREPLMAGQNAEGHPYSGFLYVGLMMTFRGPKVIEFNVRFGDPEAQVVVPMIAEDLAPRLAAAADGALDDRPVSFRPERHVGVVLASRDYPASSPVGLPIAGLAEASQLEDVLVFHASTAERGGRIVTAGAAC